ncbi:MAG: alpha/beta hydrolase [Vicingaceae bacterium]|nr:alpha/beta hydrolase [Vicingaceae bacterium]
MSNTNHIVVKKTAIYHTLGNLKTAKTIWYVLHGYGMLSEFFIKKFEVLLNQDTCIIAPEGLSKFYTQGFYGRVGATWMTKEDREIEIQDYINYLNQLHQFISSENSNTDLKINLLGFSQGGATVSRWAANGKVKFNNLILWASVFPEDMNFKKVNTDNTFLLYGSKDEFATHEKVNEQKALLNNKASFSIIEFEGKHDIPKDVLIKQTQLNNW